MEMNNGEPREMSIMTEGPMQDPAIGHAEQVGDTDNAEPDVAAGIASTATVATIGVRPKGWPHCGNCGVKLEPDPSLDVIQLKLRSSLFGDESIYVGDALSEVFKTRFPEEILDGSILCHPCSLILKDLYIIWNSFTSKSSSTASLYRFLTDVAQSQPMNLIIPKKSPRKRLKLKIARRKQSTKSTVDEKRRGKRKITRREVTKRNSHDTRHAFSPANNDDDAGFDFDVDFRNTEGSDTMMEQSTRNCGAKRRGSRKKVTNALPDQSEDETDVALTKRPRRRKSAQAVKKIDYPQGVGDEEDQSDERDEDVSNMDSEELNEEEEPVRPKRATNKGNGKPKKKRQSKRVPKPIVCLECGKRFLSTNGLTRHQLSIHLNIHGPFICKIDTCGGKKFPDQKSLESHMNVHFGIKPFICDQCGWATTGETLLRSHLRVHLKPEEKDELKTKICEICGAKFIKNRDLSAHLIVHSDVKAFHCAYEGCQAKFKLRTKLNLHEKEVHLDIVEKHPCRRCGRIFNRKHNLKLHMERHDKYDLIGKGMRKSRDPPIRDKKTKRDVSLVEEPEERSMEKGQGESPPTSSPDLLPYPYPPHFLAQSYHRI